MLQRLGRMGTFIAALIFVMGLVWYVNTTTQAKQTPRVVPARPNIAVTFLASSPTPKPRPTRARPQPQPTPVPFVATLQPVATAKVEAAPVPASPSSPSLPTSAQLDGMRHQQQTWNNCGPATLSMLLSYFGHPDTQQDIARVIKPFNDDKNVGSDELLRYATAAGYRARVVVGGNTNQLKALVASGLPVIVETWFIPEPNDEMGHYQLLVGYDGVNGDTLRFFDSYHGPNVQHSVAEFDPLWRVFNRLFIVAWQEEQEEQVKAILGAQWDETEMLKQALATAQAEAEADPQDKFAWFNIGTNALKLGDAAGAVEAYKTADALKLPWRMLWYQFGLYEAHFAQGNYAEVIKLANRTLKVQRGLEESYYWRGKAYAAQGRTQSARQDFQRALENNSGYVAAQEALAALP
jgi:hypothetical protein